MSAQKAKRRVGKYELGGTIGVGTFAKVRFARNCETGEHVAIKILDREKVLKHKMVEQVSFESLLKFLFLIQVHMSLIVKFSMHFFVLTGQLLVV